MKKKNSKVRVLVVLFFIILYALISFISIRGDYLQYKELGEKYITAFWTSMKYKYILFGISFVIIFILFYFTNRGIKKGLKVFFDKEEKQMPKLLNKSISFVFSVIISTFISNNLLQKLLLFNSNVSFEVRDPIFNLDISFYMFQKPFFESILIYFITIFAILTIYMVIYYIIVFNKFFDSIDPKTLKESLLIKKIIKNIMFVVVAISILTALNITNISLEKMLTIKDTAERTENIEIIGAGYTNVLIQRWGYLIFSIVIIIFVARAIHAFNKNNTSKVIKNLLVIPGYLVGMFIILVGFNLIFVNSNTLDKQKQYLDYNIEYTKNAYNIDIEEKSLEYSGTISQEDINLNMDVINNIKILNSDVVLKNLEENQTGIGYYSYKNANIGAYDIEGQYKLVYTSPREISSSERTYNNKTYEYTHGKGEIVIDATEVQDSGHITYIQKDINGKDDKLGILNQDIYFGLETNYTIATNIKNKTEYDYTDEVGKEYTSVYNGEAGVKLNFFDRLILGIKTGNLKLAFSGSVTSDSKILVNRNIIKRAKKAIPYLVYDEEPYTVVTNDGRIVWVLDAYTISNKYPYSQYISIEHDGIKEKINYIRNSIKVIIDSYDGTMKFYITDKTDPIAMAYKNLYPSIFEDVNTQIPEDISSHLIYPKYLYNVQAELLRVYHNVKTDVLYRTDDVWSFAKYNNTMISKSSGTTLKPYYTMIEDGKKTKIGLIQIYTPKAKQNIISYLVGTTENNTNKLKLYKFSEDSSILGTIQLDNQIEQDQTIYSEIKNLDTTGAKISKDMIVVPVGNTLLLVEPIYQTMMNEESKIPVLKKIIVASGDKLAVGDTFKAALENLLSKEATNIEIENTDDIDGLINAIIKANKNLKESMNNNNWEFIGTDINKIQSLIESLEKEKEKEDKKKEEENKANSTNNIITNSTNDILSSVNNLIN